MSKNSKRQSPPGNRTGAADKIQPEPGRESALPVEPPVPGQRTRPDPEDERRPPARR